MGFIDFIFGKKEEGRNKPTSRPASSTRPTTSQAAHGSVQTQQRVEGKPQPTLDPFVFVSDCHQRYQNGEEVMGLQQCTRTVRVEKNTSGCRGYKLNPGDGYIVKVYNDDLGKPNMSDKPMRIVNKTADKVELRGFPIEAQTPFGWQEVDYRDYGFTVYYEKGKVVKCVLHMFDRNVDLEYRKLGGENDRYATMINQSAFNPFNLTTNPALQNPNKLPNFLPVFAKELSSTLNNSVLRGIQSEQEIVKGYVFNLIESYYNNAGYVPKNTLDEILSEVYKALESIGKESVFPSKDNFKYQMYDCFLNN